LDGFPVRQILTKLKSFRSLEPSSPPGQTWLPLANIPLPDRFPLIPVRAPPMIPFRLRIPDRLESGWIRLEKNRKKTIFGTPAGFAAGAI
jgi:hypothetical protein